MQKTAKPKAELNAIGYLLKYKKKLYIQSNRNSTIKLNIDNKNQDIICVEKEDFLY